MADARVFQVSELTDLLKIALEREFPFLVVEGEISNMRPAPSGHLYFTLKDRGAMIQAVMFKGRAMRLGFAPADGMLVRASGSVTVYAARGNYQLLCESMERAGTGDILATLEERKRALAAEGLFDESRKRPIPVLPARVAVITSPTGAAIRDILNVLGRRNAGIRVVILPTAVQGDEAPGGIVRQIATANAYGLGDVIILARGGGSLEDLLAFSDEAVVRAVASSSIPVISAVGHEIDWSLSDFAADLRAPTPSAAAELVSASTIEMGSRVSLAGKQLLSSMEARISNAKSLVRGFSAENLELQFNRILQPRLQRFDDGKEGLIYGLRDATTRARSRMEIAMAGLVASNPEAVFARGFAAVRRTRDGSIVRSGEELAAGDELSIRFARGSATAITKEVRP